jgi:hypothetical protein
LDEGSPRTVTVVAMPITRRDEDDDLFAVEVLQAASRYI